MSNLRIGIDIGGTFTDFVVFRQDSHQIETFKLPSTPDNPAQAVFQGLASIIDLNQHKSIEIVHGSTVATNALIERKGARTALVTTKGFRDVLQIGRQNRSSLYDLLFSHPKPLVPADRRLEVSERVNYQGLVEKGLSSEEVERITSELSAFKPESIAVCLLFSFLFPAHEQLIGEQLNRAGYSVSLSSDVLPEYREYERTSTTVVNAYVSPVIDRYLSSLEDGLSDYPSKPALRVMQSNGGAISPQEARAYGVKCILSGPAGGVIGSDFISRVTKNNRISNRLITFDMGGTSTDVSLMSGKMEVTTEASIGDHPVCVPVLNIHTIGAGGGSIAQIDPGGALRVGPQSAGAFPGPACYGNSSLPTVTDANLVLGRLAPEFFLDGKIPLDTSRARAAIQNLAASLGISITQAALGIIEVANTHMERALRVITVERGHDPRDFALLSFGGAGGLHACELGRQLGISHLIIPAQASVLSALGMLVADIIKDYSKTVMLSGEIRAGQIQDGFAPMLLRGRAELKAEGVSDKDIQLECFLDMRYRGQSYELIIPYDIDYQEAFHKEHHSEYGYALPEAPLELVNLRVRATGKVLPPDLLPMPESGEEASAALIDTRPVNLSSEPQRVPFYRGEMLLPRNRLEGPAVVVRKDTTILLSEATSSQVDLYGNLIVELR